MSKSLFAVALAAMTLVPLAGAFANPDTSSQAETTTAPIEKKKTSDAMTTKPAATTTTAEDSTTKPAGNPSMKNDSSSTSTDPLKSEPSSAPSDSMMNPSTGSSLSQPTSTTKPSAGSSLSELTSTTKPSAGSSLSEPTSPTKQ